MPDQRILIVMGIILLASAFRTAFGFGEALISVPLLALMVPLKVAAPIAVLVSIVIASFVALRDRRHIQMRSARLLLSSTLIGLPFGLLILKIAPEPLMKSILGGVLLVFSGYSLLFPRRMFLEDDRFAWLFGFSAGVFGGSYGLNGPPLAIYGALRRWPPERFRATLQAYFLPASVLGICGYGFVGLWTPVVTHLFIWSIPALAAGILAGRVLSRGIGSHRFASWIHFALLLIAVILLAQNM